MKNWHEATQGVGASAGRACAGCESPHEPALSSIFLATVRSASRHPDLPH